MLIAVTHLVHAKKEDSNILRGNPKKQWQEQTCFFDLSKDVRNGTPAYQIHQDFIMLTDEKAASIFKRSNKESNALVGYEGVL